MPSNNGMRKALVLFAAVFFCARTVEPSCRCGSGELEIVFVIDATGSMHPMIGTLKAQLAKIAYVLEGHVRNLRLGAVAYRTLNDPEWGDRGGVVVRGLSSDRKALVNWIMSVKARGGGIEAVERGLAAALNRMQWSADARKVIVLLGDEPPGEEEEGACYALAAEAKKKGIVVHTITSSSTAWMYFKNELQNRPALARGLRIGTDDQMRRSFRMPVFVRVAELSGGMAVGTASTRELVKHLLVFAIGARAALVDPRKLLEWEFEESPPEKEPPEDVEALVGRVIYSGDWRTPRPFAALVEHLAGKLRLAPTAMVDLRVTSPQVGRCAFLYLSGHGPVRLSREEEKNLKRYLEGGGRLWADACCGSLHFDTSFRALVEELFGKKLHRLPAAHEVFDSGYELDGARYTTEHGVPGCRSRAVELWGLKVGGEDRVLYSPHSLGSGWRTYPYGVPCMMHDDDALALSENILVYFFTR